MVAANAAPGMKKSDILGYVYFVKAVGLPCIKIGWSDNVFARLARLDTGSPVKLEGLGVIRGTIANEKDFHRRFAASRIRHRREWFRETIELRDLIDEETYPWPTGNGWKGLSTVYDLVDWPEGLRKGDSFRLAIRCIKCQKLVRPDQVRHRYESEDDDLTFELCDKCARCEHGRIREWWCFDEFPERPTEWLWFFDGIQNFVEQPFRLRYTP